MKIQLISDIHIEWGTKVEDCVTPSADILIIAGDIDSGDLTTTLNKFGTMFKHVIAIMGNHDFYGHQISSRVAEVKAKLSDNVHLLDREKVVIGGYTFVGCTLWSDFKEHTWATMYSAKMGISDFYKIKTVGGVFLPEHAYEAHVKDKQYIRTLLKEAEDLSKVVVITHFLPSLACIAPQWKGDSLNHYFTGQCDDLFEEFDVPLWLFGHSHGSMDLMINNTRVLSNCHGYPREQVKGFKKDLVIDLQNVLGVV